VGLLCCGDFYTNLTKYLSIFVHIKNPYTQRTMPHTPPANAPANAPAHIAIVGAGLVGTLLAIYLSKKGHKITVYDRRPDLRTAKIYAGRSINLALSHRGWLALQGVGIHTDIQQIGLPMYARMVHTPTGDTLHQPYGTNEQAIYSVSRSTLNLKLLQLAAQQPNVEFYFDEKCLDINFETTQITLQNQRTQAITHAQADLIFGADGAYSEVRHAMQMQPRFDFSQDFLAHGYKELTIPALPNGAFALDKNALHIWGRKNFMLIALPNLDGSFTCTLFFPFDGDPSFNSLKTDAHVKSFFDEYFTNFAQIVPDCVQQYQQNPTSTLVTMQCYPWRNQNTMLIGDAAHAIVPFYGQGMNCSFEDCTILNEILENETDWNTIFDTFQQSRKPNADAIAALAQYNFVEMRDLTSNPEFILRKKIEAKIHQLHPDTWLPLYSMVTFSHIPYNQALRTSTVQNNTMQQILQLPDIANLYQTPDFTTILQPYITQYTQNLQKELSI
jgi:kynurenine 3-monooxygenase